jgi:metal-sulfur cluster biosynthetic enzyme
MPRTTPAAVLTEADILAALRDCYDPEIPCNIVDLGLVHSISVAPDPNAPGARISGVPPRHRVRIALTPRSLEDSEPTAQLIAQIENRLAAFQTVSRTEVSLLAEPRWTPDHISPAGRARLANRLTSNQPANALVQIQTQSD